MPSSDVSVVCVGAGPAGLTAAYLLAKENVPVCVLEKDPQYLGGISRTATYKNFAFDIGGHRFFSKSAEVENLWTEILGEADFLERPRKSRIYYRNRLFDYPLRARDALMKLGPLEALRCVLSYAKARAMPVAQPKTFEQWVTNQFGRRLFEIFFRTYTEKVWGMKCSDISADWAAQRIKGLSLLTAIWHSLMPQRKKPPEKTIKTLVDSFRYPRRGPGMLWEKAADHIRERGGDVLLDRSVEHLERDADTGRWIVTSRDAAGTEYRITCDHVVTSMPMRHLATALSPAPSERMRSACEALRYRDFLVVALMVKDRRQFDDNWIYIHSPDVQVGRIQNFRSWSPDMVPQDGVNCLGLEYFCFEGDGLWASDDQALVRLATDELVRLGLAEREDILDGTVVRQPKAYPVYDDAYQDHVGQIRSEVETRFPGLHMVGRNGMHKYNNQDHAMMTAMLTVRNILARKQVYDVWNVNQDAEYHEAGRAGAQQVIKDVIRMPAGGERLVPMRA
jgi:protoporphyrinogen oxidase